MTTSAPKAPREARGPGERGGEVDRRVPHRGGQESAGDQAAGERPDKLRGRVEERIRRLHLSEPQERQRRRGVDVRPAALPPAPSR